MHGQNNSHTENSTDDGALADKLRHVPLNSVPDEHPSRRKSGEDDKKPFWPPLDAQVIKAARNGLERHDRGISWKKMDDMEQYVRMMQAIDGFARKNGCSDACEWEYDVWQTNDEL